MLTLPDDIINHVLIPIIHKLDFITVADEYAGFYKAVRTHPDFDINVAFMMAVKAGHLEAVKHWDSYRKGGGLPLYMINVAAWHNACKYGRLHILKYLDTTVHWGSYDNFFFEAAMHFHLNIVDYMIKNNQVPVFIGNKRIRVSNIVKKVVLYLNLIDDRRSKVILDYFAKQYKIYF